MRVHRRTCCRKASFKSAETSTRTHARTCCRKASVKSAFLSSSSLHAWRAVLHACTLLLNCALMFSDFFFPASSCVCVCVCVCLCVCVCVCHSHTWTIPTNPRTHTHSHMQSHTHIVAPQLANPIVSRTPTPPLPFLSPLSQTSPTPIPHGSAARQ